MAGGEGQPIPGGRLPAREAGKRLIATEADVLVSAGSSIDRAAGSAAATIVSSAGRAKATAGAAVSTAGAGLSVAFADVDAMSSALSSLSDFVGSAAASAGRILADPNLTESAILSPGTAIAAEGALGIAAAQLSATLVRTKALTIVTASVVSTYALVDASLAATAGTLTAGAGLARSTVVAGSTFAGAALEAGWAAGEKATAERLRFVGIAGRSSVDEALAQVGIPLLLAGVAASVVVGVSAEALRALAESFDWVAEAFGAAGAFNPFDTSSWSDFAVLVADEFDRNFSMDNALATSVTGLRMTLGATGPLYDDILGGAIAFGSRWGFFDDGSAVVKRAELDEQGLSALEDSAARSCKNIYGTQGEFTLESGRVVPTDWPSMMAGLKQLDEVGSRARADIRILTVHDVEGAITEYRVQIPSTLYFGPDGQSGSPADFTSDGYMMWLGTETTMAKAVLDAMRQAGIPTGPDATPVQIDGFSLGGIAAGALAADPHGFNITEIHTAGAPIGRMEIPDRTKVFGLEASQDPVAALDGTTSPRGWTPIRESTVRLTTDGNKTLSPIDVHNADRYGAMGLNNPEIPPGTGALFVPPDGFVTVEDYFATRTHQ